MPLRKQTLKETGIWVEADGSKYFGSAGAIPKYLEELAGSGITDVYLQLYRGGKCWFESSLGDDTPFRTVVCQGGDPLAISLTHASRLGLRLHAWINVFNLGNVHAGTKVLRNLGLDALVTDNLGVRIDSYLEEGAPPDERESFFRLDSPGVWLDPGVEKVKEFLCSLIRELFQKYPALSGLHLDFFRYPYLLPLKPSSRVLFGYDFGYGAAAIDSFAKSITDANPFAKAANSNFVPNSDEVALKWDSWRRDNLDRCLSSFKEIIGAQRELSVAALAWPERAYFTAFQNWRRWLRQDCLDKVCLMSYTADAEHFSYLVRQACAFRSGRSRLIAGVGTYLMADPGKVSEQVAVARQEGADGAVLFSFGNICKERRTEVDLKELLQTLP